MLSKPNFKTKNIYFEKSHNAENCKKGDPFGFLKIQFVAKYQKLKGDPLETFKNFRKKVSQSRKN